MSAQGVLDSLLALPPAQLQHAIAQPQVHSVVVSLLSSDVVRVRQLVHLVISRLSTIKGALDLPLLVLYIKHYYRSNSRLVKQVVDDAFATSLQLQQLYVRLIPATLEQELEDTNQFDVDQLETILSLYLVASRHFTTISTAVLSKLDHLYSRRLDINDREHDYLRLLLVETFSSLLVNASSRNTLDQLHEALESLALGQNPTLLTRHVEQTLHVSKHLSNNVQGSVGPVARHVKDLIGKLRKLDQDDLHVPEWVERIQKKQSRVPTNEVDSRTDQVELESTVTSIQELFPHLSQQFLRQALQHSSLNATSLAQASERLIAGLLEDNLPIELVKLRDATPSLESSGSSPTSSRTEEQRERVVPTPLERRNVYDEDRNFTKGTLIMKGASQRNDRKHRNVVELDDRLKESIIALAEAPSSDDEEDDEGEAFLAEDQDELGSGSKVTVRDNGEEDEDDESDEPERPLTTTELFNPATVRILEDTWTSNPNVFGTSSEVRRSAARKRLKEATRLDDGQLEGWRIMLEKDPKKMDKLQQRVMDRGAKGNHVANEGTNGGGAGSGAGRGRGGRGGNGGGGNRGGAGGRGRGGGKGDGGRAQHDRRKRGNDKKLARMGANPVS
ncbi:uncharacterized protein JCM15063_001681 [Sporobolomyces koalae]|uniref:uncharacterized protein n=1 Tax=Sporobolomyces koalae TaxID=500713 RepID=UPI003181C273